MLRIFLSSSHLSTLFMALHAKKTRQTDCRDILIVESAKIKESLLKLIHDTNTIHKWDEIHDFVSAVSDEEDMKPTFRKTLTRKLKTKPIAKQIYNALHESHIKKERKKLKEKLETILKNRIHSPKVELNFLPQTLLNPVLMGIFPNAKLRYFEHGLGDYLHAENLNGNEFYCVFSEQLKKYLSEKGINNEFVSPSVTSADFEKASIDVIDHHPNKETILNSFKEKNLCVLILMESVEMYNVKKSFWTEYLEKCLEQIPNPNQFTFLLKPHPAQSIESIEITKSFFEKKGLKYKMLDAPSLTGMSIEILFPLWKDNINHVFALFSSSLFYLSVLYPESHITYHYSYEFMAKHIGNAPEQYKKHFYGLGELIEKVFSSNCRKFL